MKSVVFAVAAFAATISTGVSAQSYDAFASFDGTQSSGDSGPGPTDSQRFIYGRANPASPTSNGVLFTANSSCFIANASACLQASDQGTTVGSLPGFAKSAMASFQYNSVDVPADRLLAHPGQDALQTFVAFVAPAAGSYLFKATFNIQDRFNVGGVGINLIETSNGALPLIFSPLAVISGPQGGPTSSYSITRRFTLGASGAAGFGIDRNGDYSNDSTGVQFLVSAVPEPATWAMMILGFGVIGAALRRKPRATATLATA